MIYTASDGTKFTDYDIRDDYDEVCDYTNDVSSKIKWFKFDDGNIIPTTFTADDYDLIYFDIEEDDSIYWTGLRIDLNTENSIDGPGISINRDITQTFEEFPYFDNSYVYSYLIEENMIKYLDKWLSDGKYICDNISKKCSNGRELSEKDVREIINNHINWYLNDENF